MLRKLLKERFPVLHWIVRTIVREAIPQLKRFLRSLSWRARVEQRRAIGYVHACRIRIERRRSVVFLHHSYYHFYYLARALRRRGWDAICVNLENPRGPNWLYYHGEDVALHATEYEQMSYNVREFFALAKKRFDLLHFAGDGRMSFFPEWEAMNEPPDIVEWRQTGRKIAYTISGCNSGVAQSTVAKWSMSEGGNACERCIWQLHPEVCNDKKNLAWGRKVDRFCDLIFTETFPALDYQASGKAVRDPVTMCLDSVIWNANLPVPSQFRLERGERELLVYHGVGNYDARAHSGRNIKGTGAVVAAIDRLNVGGIPVRLVFVSGMRNLDVRFYQVQCDVIVDQLNYGRYGATAREGMMLGKPTICYINLREPQAEQILTCLEDVPLVSATEQTVYGVLRDLLLNPQKRERIGQASRNYALKWHSAEACAERYEQIYDKIMDGKLVSGERPLRIGERTSCDVLSAKFTETDS
ncbi:MAG: glycosyltransferase [Nitrospiraceae bacterium]